MSDNIYNILQKINDVEPVHQPQIDSTIEKVEPQSDFVKSVTELEKKYQVFKEDATPKRRIMDFDNHSRYWSGNGEYQDAYGDLYDQLVPKQGKADTVEGELLRAVGKIIYRHGNDGDNFSNSSYEWIEKHVGKFDHLDDMADKVVLYVLNKKGDYTPNNVDWVMDIADYGPGEHEKDWAQVGCQNCGGTGEIEYENDDGEEEYEECDSCDGNGWIDINDVRGVYKANKHPDVLSGKKTEQQILQEFLQTFEMAHSMRENDTPNYVVTKEEFEEYYNNISCSIDDDMYFMLMINNAWKLTEESRQGQGTKGWGSEGGKARAAQDNNIFGRPKPAVVKDEPGLVANAKEGQVLEHIQQKIKARGARGLSGIQRKFKIADDNRSGALDKQEFKKAMHDFRVGLNDQQVGVAFGIFDRDGQGEISYDEFLRTIVGEMNQRRVAVAKKAFKIMDKDGSGILDLNDIRQNYNAKQHPDVKSGKKTEDEILGEFLDTFEDHFCDMKGQADARDGKVNMNEWLEYYNNVSMSIDNDEYFDLMMNNAWNLDGKRVTKKGWGGEV